MMLVFLDKIFCYSPDKPLSYQCTTNTTEDWFKDFYRPGAMWVRRTTANADTRGM